MKKARGKMQYKSIKGTRDILPSESYIWQAIEDKARNVFARFGYDEIRTPVIEETALFIKSVGENTDIVTKEMFSFVDRGERNISLRPEGTAPVVRAYIENNLDKISQFQKLYYMGPMFRAERPQAGRMRQFHQIGVEAIGSASPALDAEVIRLMTSILDAVGIKDYALRINNLGCQEDKKKLSDALRAALSSSASLLCEDCRKRLKTNPLRVLDCKNENCKAIIRGSFKSVKFFCEDCDNHFKKVLGFLDSLKVKYTVDPYIVRGLDYYTRTVFEITHGALGSQDAIGAGGRYDSLTSSMGGPELGACGFALGVDRIMLALEKGASEKAVKPGIDLFVSTIGETAYQKAFALLDALRSAGIPADMDYEGRSLKAQMRAADKCGAKFVLIIGEDELARGEALLRDMSTKEQMGVKFEELVGKMKSEMNSYSRPKTKD
jgi:histidyl-tRNA synthetase